MATAQEREPVTREMLENIDWGVFRAGHIAEMIGLGFSDAEAAAEARTAEARAKARIAWGLDLADRLDAAWERMEEEYGEMDDAAFDALPPPPEQAKVDELMKLADDVIERGRLPRHLYFGGV